ncbi:MAG: type II toxin-antitoxin system prevent-host-death family antitoxin [Pseudomonadota bacterium]
MDVLNFTETRANLKAVMDRVVDDCVPVVITRQKGKPVVMISLDVWNSMEETEYLLSSPENAKRLRRSIAQLNAGKGMERELIKS